MVKKLLITALLCAMVAGNVVTVYAAPEIVTSDGGGAPADLITAGICIVLVIVAIALTAILRGRKAETCTVERNPQHKKH